MIFGDNKVIKIICTTILTAALMLALASCSWKRKEKISTNDEKKVTVSEEKKAVKVNKAVKKRKISKKTEKSAHADAAENKYSEIMEKAFGDINAYQSGGIYSFGEQTGFETENSKEAFISASVVKLFIAEYTLLQVDNGAMSYETFINGQSVKSLLEQMITVSDNNAANVFINHFGMDTLNEFFAGEGYTATRVERRMLDFAAQQNGKENYTSTHDVMKLLKKIYDNQSLQIYSDLLGIMKRQQVKTKIQLNLPQGVTAANKTGELSNVENDVGIIFTPRGDYAVCFLLNRVGDNASARRAISDCVNVICE